MSNRYSQPSSDQAAITVAENDVVSYLKNHPDFFRENAGLLGDMSLPHANGSAVSLVERQVAILRERSLLTRRKLGELVDHARENDELFNKTQALVLKLIKADSRQALFDTISDEFSQSFDVQHTAIFMLADGGDEQELPTRNLAQAGESIRNILGSDKTFCGALRSDESQFFFDIDRSDEKPMSAAIVKRDTKQGEIVIAVAHDDGNHYNSDTGTLFINYIADIVQALLNRQTA